MISHVNSTSIPCRNQVDGLPHAQLCQTLNCTLVVARSGFRLCFQKISQSFGGCGWTRPSICLSVPYDCMLLQLGRCVQCFFSVASHVRINKVLCDRCWSVFVSPRSYDFVGCCTRMSLLVPGFGCSAFASLYLRVYIIRSAQICSVCRFSCEREY